ncbi:MAG: flagellar hook-basal body complex protein FliE [Candidatus Thiodiazotropha sp. L084R]
MSMEAISFIKPTEGVEFNLQLNPPVSNGAGNFASWFDNQMGELNNQINTSEMDLRKLATGETNNIHHVMMSLEKAKLSFQLMLQVRNKALEAYQDVMRMQI